MNIATDKFFIKNTRFRYQSIELNLGIIFLGFLTRAAIFGGVQGQNNMDCQPNKGGENVFNRVTGGAESATDYVSPTMDMDLDPLARDHSPPTPLTEPLEKTSSQRPTFFRQKQPIFTSIKSANSGQQHTSFPGARTQFRWSARAPKYGNSPDELITFFGSPWCSG